MKQENETINTQSSEQKQEEQVETQIEEHTQITEQPDTQSVIEALMKENEELKDKYIRLAAEFDNYKKRQQNIFNEMLQQERDNIMAYLLSVSDEIDMALKAVMNNDDPTKITDGVKAIKRKIDTLLELEQIERFDCDGEVLDPFCHEAISVVPTDCEEKDGTIVCTVSPGFKRCGKLIRPAKVIVAKFDKKNKDKKEK